MENTDPNIARVQHVAKTSSDQLLRKFAEVGSDPNDAVLAGKELRLAKRVKRNVKKECASESNSKSLGERKSLLPPAASRKPAAALVRRLGMSKAKIKAREIKTKSIIITIEKTWRKTIEGASRVLMEKKYNRHKRLINISYNN